MPATTKTPLGAPTLVRDWYYDIDNNDGVGTPSWLPIGGISNQVFNPDNANLEDDSDFDSAGYGSQAKTATAWTAQLTVVRKVLASDQTSYDPGQEKLRSKMGKLGNAAIGVFRIYEMTPNGPRLQAYTGSATVAYEPQGGANTALDTVQATLTGRGQLAAISHPDTGAAVPTISGVQVAGATPLTIPAAGGAAVRITGNRFTGTTTITFIGTSAPSFIVASDGVINVTAPAHAAGSGNLVVTNAAGASTGFAIAYV